MRELEVGDRIEVLVGWAKGKYGRVETINPDQAKSVGVIIPGGDGPVFTTWFKPEEIN